ncbi:hypothetical protein ABB37_02905 [Leptomonas pyrrhocoris]|uniref:Uncharacterized protein n=1 Tax=Leptomonas pyrrhocoris TaxID=157538 RepID=A0A0N0VGJ3_LEPPY|nr:hypothetical protein ABB37_02905 [Leptomonas pyrrhocoris]KPA83224.1 hypothetical protein ABB37_02905 [Leptomonas pyrrhocoris]|eukprot:XP_015661663.1 hypothetical protein ABB37_02905 [Leptomonas pyrrhocoris]
MSNTHKKLLPIGSNMNDAAYPFRGQHKMEDCINHGHSGVAKKAPTSIGMRITGSNLVIEQVQTPKGVELECELGVDGGIPRPVSLQQASALMVPGDGHDYNLLATVKANGSTTKHYCKLTFNGSEGSSVLRVRAPEGCPPEAVYIVADGRRLRPTAGWFRIPIQTKDCALVANLPMMDNGGGETSGVAFLSPPRNSGMKNGQRCGSSKSPLSQQRSPTRPGSGLAREPTTPADAYFFLETVTVDPPTPSQTQQALLVCISTGHVIPLTPQGTVAVPHAGAPFRLVLPAKSFHDGMPAVMAAPAGAPKAVPEIETRIQPFTAPINPLEAAGANVPPASDGTPAAAGGAAMPSFVATAPNFTVQLIGEDGSSATGQGVATLPLTHRRAQAIQIIVRDAQGNVMARQKSNVPALQAAPTAVRMRDDGSGNVVVSTNAGNKLTVGGVPQANPLAGALLPRVVPQQVVVEQPNADGSVSSVALEVAAKGSGDPAMPLGTNPVPVPIPVGGGTPAAAAATAANATPEKWVMELCAALQKPNPEEQRRLVQAIQPSTLPGMTVVNFVRDQLTRQPPAIFFTVSKNGLESVQCPGCSVSASVGSDPPRTIPSYGSVQLVPGKPATLTATSMSTQRPVSACRVQMSNMVGDNPNTFTSTSSGYNPYGSSASGGAPADKGDTELVTRVLDSLIRHNVNAAQVADELGGMSTAPFSSQGRRLLPLLTTCLRSASANGAASAAAKAASDQAAAAAAAAAQAKTNEEIFFTCGPGYVDNIYTSTPQLHLFGAIDEQAPQVLQQRGRVPAQGTLEGDRKPFFIRITARDPTTGAVKAERTITVLGVSQAAQVALNAAPAPPSAAAVNATPSPALLSSQGAAGYTPVQAQPDAVRTEGPFAAGAAANTAMQYIDVSLQTVGQDVQVRFLCPPHLRIVCDVDGVGGHTGQSDFVTKMPALRAHRVNLSLVDTYGKVVFQQKLDVPAMTSPVWGLAVQHNGLSVDPESGSLATASVDRSPERALQGNFLSFDASVPHYVNLRKYLNGVHGCCVGEVSLRLPGLTLPPELAEVTSLLRRRANGQLSDPQAKAELQQLLSRCTSPAVAELIRCILSSWSGAAGGPAYSLDPDSPSNRVFFRLTGTD